MNPADLQSLVDDVTALLVCEFSPAIPLSLPVALQVERILRQPSVVQCNRRMAALCHIDSPEKMYGYALQDLFRHVFPGMESMSHLVGERLRAASKTGYQQEGVLTRWWLDGEQRHFIASYHGVIQDNHLHRLVILHRDDTMGHRQRALQQASHHVFFEQAPLGMCAFDIGPPLPPGLDVDRQIQWLMQHCRYAECNQAVARLVGRSCPDELVGRRLIDTPLDLDMIGPMRQLIDQNYRLHDEPLQYRGDSGRERWLSVTVSPVHTTVGLSRLLVVVADTTERMEYTRQIEHRARHDSLTGLPNRAYFYEVAEKYLACGNGTLAVCLLDLDGFKEINDTLGHDMGDKVLREIGPRLQQVTAADRVMVARLGGDEFAILLPDYESLTAVKQLADTIIAAVQRPFRMHEIDLVIGASMGIALYPEQGNSVSALMRCADIAMYQAKRQARQVELYQSDHDHYTVRRLSLMMDIRQAIANDELSLWFQPIVALGSGTVIAFELLLRWQHPQHGELLPGEFIPLIELTDMMEPLTWWVLTRAVRVLQSWQVAGWPYQLAVNISARNIADSNFSERVRKLLEQHGVAGDRLILEITESALMADPHQARRVLQAMGDLGIQFSIDDYGTGYSSLAYLRSLPIHTLKIDRTFISQMLDSEQDRIIVASTIQLAHNLGLRVTAEGIEHYAVLAALRRLGCEHGQGFFIARPMRGRMIADWTEQYRLTGLYFDAEHPALPPHGGGGNTDLPEQV